MSERNRLTTDQLTALGQALAHLMTTAENSIGPVHAKHAREAAGKLLWIAGIPEFKGAHHRTPFHAVPPSREIDGQSSSTATLLPAASDKRPAIGSDEPFAGNQFDQFGGAE